MIITDMVTSNDFFQPSVFSWVIFRGSSVQKNLIQVLKVSEKLIFYYILLLAPIRNVSLSENFAYFLNGLHVFL